MPPLGLQRVFILYDLYYPIAVGKNGPTFLLYEGNEDHKY